MKGTVYTLHAHGVRQQAARGVRVRRLTVFGRFALCIFLVFALICQPYTIVMDGWHIKAQKQEAQAVPAAIPVALEFLEAIAAAAGMSVADFELTCAISIAASTGFNMLNEAARYGADGTLQGLHHLVATTTWPSWNELSDSEKQSWGTEANYSAAQFNSSLTVFGLGDARDSYYSTGGGDFDGNTISLAQQIGDMGRQWAEGYKTDLGQFLQMVPNPESIFDGYSKSGTLGTTPSLGVPKTKKYEDTNLNVNAVQADYIWGNGTKGPSLSGPVATAIWSDRVVVGSIFKCDGFSSNQVKGVLASDQPFQYGGKWVSKYDVPSPEYPVSSNALTGQWNGKTFYYTYWGSALYTPLATSAPLFLAGSEWVEASSNSMWIQLIAYVMVYGNEVYDSMPEYAQQDGEPEYPAEGVGARDLGPDTSWPSLFGDTGTPTPPPTPTPNPGYPESDFNPNVSDDDSDYVPETSTPEWQQQTQDQIFTPALNLPFDEMFPFCVIWDISKLMNKLYELGGYQAVSADQSTSLRGLYDKREGLQVQADEASRGGAQLNAWSKPGWTAGHTEFMLPLADFGIYGMYDLELDVWPLAVLLAWLKPFFQLAFIAGLLYVTIVTFRMFIFTD